MNIYLPLSNKDIQGGQSSEHSSANAQNRDAQPTMSRLLLQLIQDGHPAPGFRDEDILLESPDDTKLDVIASAEAIRRLAQNPQDQAVMNSEEQVFRTRFLVT